MPLLLTSTVLQAWMKKTGIDLTMIGLMALVATAGLDDLPRSLKQSVAAASGRLANDRAAFERDSAAVEAAIAAEPALFANKAGFWRSTLDRDRERLTTAAATLATLQQLAKANRRIDSDKASRALQDAVAANPDKAAMLRQQAEVLGVR